MTMRVCMVRIGQGSMMITIFGKEEKQHAKLMKKNPI